LIRGPAKLTGARHELCAGEEPTRPGVGGLSRKHYTQCVEQHRRRDTAETKVKTGRGPIMEEMLCAMSLKSSN
jgi:hypothetical protein